MTSVGEVFFFFFFFFALFPLVGSKELMVGKDREREVGVGCCCWVTTLRY